MSIKVKQIQSADAPAWDAYVHAHPKSTLYHLYSWKNIIEKTYGHKTYYLMATKNTQQPASSIQHSVPNTQHPAMSCVTKSHKVRMLLKLPESSEILMKSFKSKLRSQIKKPVKEGLKAKIGSLELIEDFYKVFLINMRDLGSPVHSKKLVQNVLEEFPEKAKIVMIYKAGQPVACSIIVGFKETLENPRPHDQKTYWFMIHSKPPKQIIPQTHTDSHGHQFYVAKADN